MSEEYMQVPGDDQQEEHDIADHPVLTDLYAVCDEIEQDRDLITLCQNCHYIFHENGKLAKEED